MVLKTHSNNIRETSPIIPLKPSFPVTQFINRDTVISSESFPSTVFVDSQVDEINIHLKEEKGYHFFAGQSIKIIDVAAYSAKEHSNRIFIIPQGASKSPVGIASRDDEGFLRVSTEPYELYTSGGTVTFCFFEHPATLHEPS